MGKPYALWGHVPVYLCELDRSEFMRDFVIPNRDPPQKELQQYDENGLPLIPGIIVSLQPRYYEVMVWHERQMREGVDSGIRASPNAMSTVPADGFYIVVERYRTFHEQKGGFGSTVEIREDVSELSFGKTADLIREKTGRFPDIPPVFKVRDYREFDD